MFKTCEYQMAVDGREDVPDPSSGEETALHIRLPY